MLLRRYCRKKSINLILTGLIIGFALLTSIVLLKANNEQSGYAFKIVKNEDQTADIVGDKSHVKNGVEIIQVTGPNHVILNKNNVVYRVSKNGVYSFQVEFTSETGKHSETIEVHVDSFKIDDVKTVGDLRLRSTVNSITAPFSIPMYTKDMLDYMGDYVFPGGDIKNIADQTFDGLPYKFSRAEIQLLDGASLKTYAINYYNEINGKLYYSLANNNEQANDFDIAYEVPTGATVSFIFDLNTKEYPVTLVNDKVNAGFKIDYITGFNVADDGSVSARYNTLAKVRLTYPNGYYANNAPAGKKNVGIEFSDPTLVKPEDKDEDFINRTCTYTFRYPDKPLTLTVIGDENKNGLIYGVFDATGNAQPAEQGGSWWQATDALGNYTEGQPYYGFPKDPKVESWGKMIVRGGTSTPIQIEGTSKTKQIATGIFNSDQELHFEYTFVRANMNAKPPYYYNPAPILSFNYFPNGADFSSSLPITETFPLWSPEMLYDPNVPETPIISNSYIAENGAKITITVKKAVYSDAETSTPGVTLHYPSFQAHVKVENMKNSFYLSTSGISSVQGTHYFRNLDNVSLNSANGLPDSYFLEDYLDEAGGSTGTIKEVGLKAGHIFIDKRAVYNNSMPGGNGVPWKANSDVFFKFGITPKWGYSNPTIESYGIGPAPIMINKPIEIEKKESEVKDGTSYPNLALGSYSWFHGGQNRKDVSPFQYIMFMPVESLTSKHEVRAIDVKVDKITGTIINNDEYTDAANPGNKMIESDTFDLLDYDKIVFSNNFKPLEKPGYTFVGFTAEITAPDNPLLPGNFKKTLYKDEANTEYFRPGDSINISDYFRRDAADLLTTWNTKKTLNEDEYNRLALLMYSSKFEVKINPIYKLGSSVEGGTVTGYVKKYLQTTKDVNLSYSLTAADTKSVKMINGTNIIFSKFAETYLNPADHYMYYLNMDNTTAVNQVTGDQQELASVKYDRGLTVSYLNADGSRFEGISDSTIYKTYAGSNQATIKFPSGSQSPPGKALDYWAVEELDESGNWVSKPGLEIKEGSSPAVYEFSSGSQANDKSIRLKAVWKDIAPTAYITIPKNILLSEKGTNLSPAEDYAGTKVTITYQSVNGSDKQINVDVLKSFDLSLITDQSKKIKVSAYDAGGNLLAAAGVNQDYARIGEFSKGSASKDIWFNTPSLNNNEVYKGIFQTSSEPSEVGQNTLFYISAITP